MRLGIFTHTEGMLIMMAYDLSKAAHRNDVRQEFSPDAPVAEKRYFNHPKWMAEEMLKDGVDDYRVIVIAFLHDCPEDTAIFGNQLTEGYKTAALDYDFRLSRMFDNETAQDIIVLTLPLANPDDEQFSSKEK